MSMQNEHERMMAQWHGALRAVELCGSVSEWASRYRYVASNASARPGPWHTGLTPYLTEIMDACSVENPAYKVVVKGSAQIGKTEALLNILGYRMHQWPAPMMVVVPRDEDVSVYSDSRIDSMIQSSPALRGLVGKTEYERDGADNAAVKRFPGGQLCVRGSRSRATYRSDPFCVVVLDDLDAFANNPEGDHAEQAEKRTNTFSERSRKVVFISTPTEQGASRIDDEYQLSSQNLYWVPCLHCGCYQVLWRNYFRWLGDDPSTAHFVCQHCGAAMTEDEKPAMLAAGQWRPERPERSGVIEGFWIWAAYAPIEFKRWSALARSWMDATEALRARHDDTKIRAVRNLDWAEVFVPESQLRLNEQEREIYSRREPLFDETILPIVVKTAGVDVQVNRIEVTLYGWGADEECWCLGHLVIKGIPEDDAVWDALEALLIEHKVGAACVDAGAFTDEVLTQITNHAPALFRAGCALYAVKGRHGPGAIWPGLVTPGNVKDGRCRVVTIHVDAGKDWLFGSLSRVTQPGPGYIHFALNMDKRFFNQLLSERERGPQDPRGAAKYLPVHGRQRNEALDCAVYARAALFARATLDERVRTVVFGARIEASERPAPKPRATRPAKKRTSRGWLTRRVL